MTLTLSHTELGKRVFAALDWLEVNREDGTPPGWNKSTDWTTHDPREVALELAAWDEGIAPYAGALDVLPHVEAWQRSKSGADR